MALASKLQAGLHLPSACTHRGLGVPRESPDVESILMWPSMTSKVVGTTANTGPHSLTDIVTGTQVWKLYATPRGRCQPQEARISGTTKVNLVTRRKMPTVNIQSLKKNAIIPEPLDCGLRFIPKSNQLLTEQTRGKEPNAQPVFS